MLASITQKNHFSLYTLLFLLLLVFVIRLVDLQDLLQAWFPGNGFSKKPVFWLFVFILMVVDIRKSQLRQTSNLGQFLFLIIPFLGILFFQKEFPFIVLALLITTVWFYLANQKSYAKIFMGFALLVFSLPYFLELHHFLQIIAVFVIESIFNLVNIPILIQEYSIAITHGQLVVEQSCSGLGYMSNNFLLLFLYSFLSRFNIRQFLLGILICVILGLLVNWLRVSSIALIAHYFGMDVPFFVKGHQNYGWMLYCIMLFPYFYLLLKVDKMNMHQLQWMKYLDADIVKIPPVFLMTPVLIYAAII